MVGDCWTITISPSVIHIGTAWNQPTMVQVSAPNELARPARRGTTHRLQPLTLFRVVFQIRGQAEFLNEGQPIGARDQIIGRFIDPPSHLAAPRKAGPSYVKLSKRSPCWDR